MRIQTGSIHPRRSNIFTACDAIAAALPQESPCTRRAAVMATLADLALVA
jgi:hypothetical protein